QLPPQFHKGGFSQRVPERPVHRGGGRDVEICLHAIAVHHRRRTPEHAITVVVLPRIAKRHGDRIANLPIYDQRPYSAFVRVEIQPTVLVLVDTHETCSPASGVSQWGGDVGNHALVVPTPHSDSGVHVELITRPLTHVVHG